MSRLGAIFSTIVFLVPVSSAQITDGGTQSIPGMISHLLGIELSNPYVLLGFTATFGIMWLSIYVIFKIGIKRFDSGYGSRRDKPLSEALGLDDKNSRNMLAVLTLLITFSTLGTGAFYGLIQGWQSLILLLFTFMLLAGLLFILIGGTGGIIGGTAYVTGKTTKTVSNSLQQAKQDIDELRSEEETIEELEDEIEDEEKDARRRERSNSGRDIGKGAGETGSSGSGSSGSSGSSGGGSTSQSSTGTSDSSTGSGGAENVEREIKDIVRKLEKVLQILRDIEEKLTDDLDKESERIDERKNQLRELRKILSSDEKPYFELRDLIGSLEDEGINSKSSDDDLREFLDKNDVSLPDIGVLQNYVRELRDLEGKLSNLEEEIELLKEFERIFERLQNEVDGAEKEEEILENLIKRLEDSEIKQQFIEKVKNEDKELDNIEERFSRLKEYISKVKNFLNKLENLENDLGNIQSLLTKLDELRSMAEKLNSYFSEHEGSHDKVKMLSFNPKDKNYISKGTKFTTPGANEEAFIDIDIRLTPERFPDELEFNNPQKNLIKQIGSEISKSLSRKNEGIQIAGSRSKQKRHLGDEDLDAEGLMLLIFEIIMSKKDISSGGSYDLSEQIKGPYYNSLLLNAIYLGSLINELTATYSTAMNKFELQGDGRALTKSEVRRYNENLNVYLSSYSKNGSPEPVVLLEDSDGIHGFLISTGKFVKNIDEKNITEIYLFD